MLSILLTIYIFSVTNMLKVAARILTAQLRLRPVGLQLRVVVPPVLGAGGHAAGGCIPHGVNTAAGCRGSSSPSSVVSLQPSGCAVSAATGEEKTGR